MGVVVISYSWLHSTLTTVTVTTAILDHLQNHVILLHPRHHQEYHIHHLVHQGKTSSQQDSQDNTPTYKMFPFLRHLLPSVWHLPHSHGPLRAVCKQGKDDSIWRTIRSVCFSVSPL